MAMVDWGAGEYERTAAELEPVAVAVVEQAALRPGEAVIDVACGTGNAALLAAARGARAVGIDSASRLVEVARERAQAEGVDVDFREGDLVGLPVDDGSAEIVLSIFGVIFASDPAAALGEVRRVLRPGGRALITAWVPAGPIHAMLAAMGSIIRRATESAEPERFSWSDSDEVARVASGARLRLESTTRRELAIRDSAPDHYVAAGQVDPRALSLRPVLERVGIVFEVQEAMSAILREANEDPDAFLVHSPYVVHELRAT
jgi:SAM-dependent methyltransferase